MNMQATFPSRVIWRLYLNGLSSFLDIFHGHSRSELEKAIKVFASSSMQFKFEIADAAYLDKFVPLYEKEISKKPDARIIDVRDRVLSHPLYQWPFMAMSLYDGDQYLGGRVFSVSEEGILGAFKVLPHRVNLPIKKVPFSFIAEYYLVEKALEWKKQFLSSGSTLNPFGVHSAIGLATYKLKSGARPYVANSRCEIKQEFVWDGQRDVLLFLGEQKDIPIQKAILFLVSTEKIEERYGNLLAHASCDIKIVTKSEAN